jgi:hypothetical protein
MPPRSGRQGRAHGTAQGRRAPRAGAEHDAAGAGPGPCRGGDARSRLSRLALRSKNYLRRRRGVRSSRSCGDTGAPAAARVRVMITFCVVPSACARSANQSAKAVATRRFISVLVRRVGMMAGGWVGAICSAISRKRAGCRRGEADGAVPSCDVAGAVAKLFSLLALILRLHDLLSLRIDIRR